VKAIRHIKDLVPDPANRRAHNPRNIGMVVDALHQVGAARSIVIDEDNVILAGNGVTEAAAEAGITKLRVIDAAGDELIAVRRSGLSAAQKRALAIYDNRTGELATWNFEQLAADTNAGLSLQPFWTPAEEAALLARQSLKGGNTDPDDIPAARATGIQPGDLFELGRHRLLCGDSTARVDVARLLGNVVPFLMVTDPPYGVNYDPSWRQEAADKGLIGFSPSSMGTVANDDRKDWTPAWELFGGAVAYVWHASMFGSEVAASLAIAGLSLRSQIIWKKPSFAIGRGHYHWQHEACWYAFRDGHSAKWAGDHSQATVWDISRTADADKTNHGTQKPVECMLRPIRNHGGKDDHVYDPFVGSGTTLIAAEQVERRCFALEITPTYCQMAIDRWEVFTGSKAVKVGEAVCA
jgi:DNA modification methylase